MKKCNIVLCVLISVLVVINILFVILKEHATIEDCVTTDDMAIKIGKIVCENKYPQFDYSKYEWECIYDTKSEIWIVFCKHTDDIIGGLPQIHIRKNNAEIVFLSLMS
ncbi:MAG: hypothetical protein E7396_01165 [Ruminococcaceae bacterium]|nr:hypothetical protein [Oscillospiraceae bacterium]